MANEMDFSLALKSIKNGLMVSRKAWNDIDKYVYLSPDGTEIYMHEKNKIFEAWKIPQDDILSNDWFIVNTTN